MGGMVPTRADSSTSNSTVLESLVRSVRSVVPLTYRIIGRTGLPVWAAPAQFVGLIGFQTCAGGCSRPRSVGKVVMRLVIGSVLALLVTVAGPSARAADQTIL